MAQDMNYEWTTNSWISHHLKPYDPESNSNASNTRAIYGYFTCNRTKCKLSEKEKVYIIKIIQWSWLNMTLRLNQLKYIFLTQSPYKIITII